MADGGKLETITFTLDGREVTAAPGESIWEVAKRVGTTIPHLCHKDAPGYRSDGNCRACMVEIEGERTLAASCIRMPREGQVVHTQNDRSVKARKGVMELLLADQPEQMDAHDRSSHFWEMADLNGIDESRYPAKEPERIPLLDASHLAMKVNLDACIHCNLCVRACREVQVNDVIGMAGRGADAKIVFDFDDPMGAEHLRRLRRVRAGLPDRRADARERSSTSAGRRTARTSTKSVDSVCPLLRRRLPAQVQGQGQTRSSMSRARTARPTRTGSA